jgi:hypothetical protein
MLEKIPLVLGRGLHWRLDSMGGYGLGIPGRKKASDRRTVEGREPSGFRDMSIQDSFNGHDVGGDGDWGNRPSWGFYGRPASTRLEP